MIFGIPTINQKPLLERSLAQLQEKSPGSAVIIVDNGGQEIALPAGMDGAVIVPEQNLGVAASWNRIMDAAFDGYGEDFVAILNDDIELAHGEKEIEAAWRATRPWLMMSLQGWCSFVISRECRQAVGAFDEGFWPATYEEHDYARRLRLALPGRERHVDLVHLDASGWGPESILDDCLQPRVMRSGQSGKADPQLEALKKRCRYHYESKWGGLPGMETWNKPFDGRTP